MIRGCEVDSKSLIDLSHRVALITGGSRGIGAAAAVLMARAGADISISYHRDRKAANSVSNAVQQVGQKCLAIQVDIMNHSKVKMGVSAILRRFGRIDIVVNNAGIWTYGEIGKMKEEVWDETIGINLKGVFNLCNIIVPIMKKQGGGKIINLSSTAGQCGEAFHSHYAASKGGVIAFTKSLAWELAPYNILVNCVAPGWVDSDMTATVFADEKFRAEVQKTIPRGKITTPEEIAGPIAFLASSLADGIVGAVLNVNGGSTLSS